MMKAQIGLGVLSIPQKLDVLGMIPGIIFLLITGGIITWSDWIVSVSKLNHRSVYGIEDFGALIAGKSGKIIMGIMFVLCEFACSILDKPNLFQSRYSVQEQQCWASIYRSERPVGSWSLHYHFRCCGCCSWRSFG